MSKNRTKPAKIPAAAAPKVQRQAADLHPAGATSLPFVLLSYQQDWLRDKADVAVWEKSRRIGASWTDAADSVLTSAAAVWFTAALGITAGVASPFLAGMALLLALLTLSRPLPPQPPNNPQS